MTPEAYVNWIDEKRAIFFGQENRKVITLIKDEARMEAQKDISQQRANSWYEWLELAAQAQRRAGYYRGLLDQCAKSLGLDISTVEDNLTQDYPDLEKIPELVKKLVTDSTKEITL